MTKKYKLPENSLTDHPIHLDEKKYNSLYALFKTYAIIMHSSGVEVFQKDSWSRSCGSLRFNK
jgi:hypothetical protein